jgi:hypothetical protein
MTKLSLFHSVVVATGHDDDEYLLMYAVVAVDKEDAEKQIIEDATKIADEKFSKVKYKLTIIGIELISMDTLMDVVKTHDMEN